MILLHTFDYSLPLTNPVLQFLLILVIILFAPILLNKIKIPHLLGLIIAGAVIGPNGLFLMERDSSITLLGAVGLLYIMFMAGLEIDIADFKKNSKKSLVFGLLTFIIPMTLGTYASIYILDFSIETSILLASMFASHTLIAYPLVSKLGVAKNRAVNITVGGTMITDTLALLVLAVIVGMSAGDVNSEFWIRLSISLVLFGIIVMFIFPLIGRWFFKRFEDNVSQYIFVLAMVFLGAILAELAGVEAIIGAFLAGLALNRLIPHTSPLMNRVEFVGNAIFIPFFLIGVGMLIDYKAFFKDLETIKVAIFMTILALSTKFIAAYITQKIYRYSKDERRLIFGLSGAQAAATLAAVLVGYNIILNQPEIDQALLLGEVIEPVRLLNENILNGTILMILITCTIASFAAQKGAKNISFSTKSDNDEQEEVNERILISINHIDSVEELVNLSITVKSKSNKNGLYALNVIDSSSNEDTSSKMAKKILDKASVTAASTDNHITELLRFDVNTINGIDHVVKEKRITDLILGITKSDEITDSYLGNLTDGLLTKCNATTLIYKPNQPLGTIKRHIIIVPDKAEKEIGFAFWLVKAWNIARNTGSKLIFYSSANTLSYIKKINSNHPIESEFNEFSDWNDFLIISRDLKTDDNLFIVMSRKDRPSYHENMGKIPLYLNKYFENYSFILVYPMQTGVNGSSSLDLKNPSIMEPIEKLDEIGKTIAKLFRKK